MGFVYAGALWLGRPWVFEDVSFVLWWMPEHSIIDRGEVYVLCNTSDPRWYSLQALV